MSQSMLGDTIETSTTELPYVTSQTMPPTNFVIDVPVHQNTQHGPRGATEVGAVVNTPAARITWALMV